MRDVSPTDHTSVLNDLKVTTEAPLTVADHEAVLSALQGDCPAGLYRLRTELYKDHRLRRGFAGGVG